MKLTARDKKLLLVLAIVAIVCIPYFFILQPMMDDISSLQSEVSQLQSDATYLEQLALMEGDYQAGAEQMASKSATLLERFPSDLLQEKNILFIHNTEQMVPVSLYQVSLGDDVAAQLTSDAEAEQIDAVEAETGDVTDDAVIEDNTTETSLGDGLTAMQTETQFAFDAGYRQFKDFLNYILEYQDRMVITDIDASYSAETDMVDGSFKLVQYALKSEGRNDVSVLEPNMIQGTTNIFRQASGSFDESEQAQEEADFFISLNQPEADIDSLIIGQSNDATEESYFASSKNDRQSVTVTFTGKEGEYNANYKIGNSSYSADGIDFEKEGSIVLQVISSARLDEDDNVAIDLNVVNKTDVSLRVLMQNDDTENPRVTIKGKTGTVVVVE